MNFLLTPSGTDGDVRPLIAFGLFLKAKGHNCIYCAPPNSLAFIKKEGFAAYPLGCDYKKVATMRITGLKENPLAVLKKFSSFIKEDVKYQFESLEKIVTNSDILISSGLNFAAYNIAEFYHKPFMNVLHIPWIFQVRDGCSILMPRRHLPYIINEIGWKFNDLFFDAVKGIINEWRIRHKLDIIKHTYKCITTSTIISVDSDLADVPLGIKSFFIKTPYWHYDDGSILDKELIEFIENGNKPYYIGFGSMAGNNEKILRETLPELVKNYNMRFIVSNGWGYNLNDLKNDSIYVVNGLSHMKLFPKVAAAIHHGASGTTHTAAIAGIPQIIIPHGMDQPVWGDIIFRHGLGPKPVIKLAKNNFYNLIVSLKNNHQYYENALKIGEKLKSYDRKEEMNKFYNSLMKNIIV